MPNSKTIEVKTKASILYFKKRKQKLQALIFAGFEGHIVKEYFNYMQLRAHRLM